MNDGQERLRNYTERENMLLKQIRGLTAEYQHLAKSGQSRKTAKVVERLEAAIDEYARERVRNTDARVGKKVDQ